MKCPADGATLVMTERQGVEIDYCPTCRGVWLDRGELDKIIDRVADAEEAAPPRYEREMPEREYYERREPVHRDYDDVRFGRPGYKRKKRGFLGDLFEFDD